MAKNAVPNPWISAANAARILGTKSYVVPRLAEEGRISVRRMPGCDPRYLLADVERLARESTIIATNGPNRGEAVDDGE
jgi:hypothetical protein